MTGASAAPRTAAPFDVERIRRDFPILARRVNGHPLVYLDSAATAQKPLAVIEATDHYYRELNANIHRGVHTLSVEATEAYEQARAKMARFVGAARTEEIVFCRGATEAINLVAGSWGRANIGRDDEIILSRMEHHSNIVPWQLLAESVGARIRVAEVNERGELDLDHYESLFSERTRLVSMIHVSNALGTVNPVREIAEIAHHRGVRVLFDGAQAAPHLHLDMNEIGCDFYAIAGHKMFGPSGIGALWARHELLESMPPYQGGGEMILSVTFEKTTYNKPPNRFEAGTPNIAGAIGLGATVDYLEAIGMQKIHAWEQELLAHGTKVLSRVPDLRPIGTARNKAAVLSFTLRDIHPHDIGTILDQRGIAVRTGHHCTQPLMERFGVAATARASLAFYNTKGELDQLGSALEDVLEVFG